MRYTMSVRETFNASHRTNSCGYGLHGHTFTAEVTVEGEPGKDGNVVDVLDLVNRLRAVVNEFAGRDLDDMLVPPIPEQLCVYLRERLALFFPTIVGVRVSTDNFTAAVEFPLR